MTTDIRVKIGLDGVPQVQAGSQQAAQSIARVGGAAEITSRQARLLTRNVGDAVRALGGVGGPLGEVTQRVSQLGLAFGGFDGVAARITPVTAVVGGLAAAVGVLALAYKQGAAESDAYARAIVLSGNAAGTTVGQLNEMAKAQAAIAGSQGKAAEVLAQLAASGVVVGAELAKATAAAIRFERAGGTAAGETAKKFVELGKDPLKALIRINEAENFLTRSVYETVKALEAQGKKTEAATVAQNAYADAVSGRAAQLEPRLGVLQKMWQALGDEAARAWNAMLNIGRDQTLEEQLASVEARIAQAGRGTQTPGYLLARSAGFRGQRLADVASRGAGAVPQDLRDEQSVLQSDLRLFRRAAEEQRRRALEIKKITEPEPEPKTKGGAGGGESPYASLIADLRKLQQTQEEELRTGGQVSEARKLQIRLVDQFAAATGKLTNEQRRAVAAEIAARVAAQESIDLQAAELKSAQEIASARVDARRREQQAIDEFLQRQRAATEQGIKAVEARTKGLADEEQAAEIAAGANVSLAEAIELVAIARLREQRARLQDGSDAANGVEREIAARERLLQALAGKASREGADKSAEEFQRAYESRYQELSQGITNALIEGGKSFREYWRGLLRSLAGRVFIEPVLRPIAGVLAGVTSGGTALAGTAAGAVGEQSVFGAVSQGASLFTAGQKIYQGFVSGFSGVGAAAQNTAVQAGLAQYGGYSANAAAIEAQAGLGGYYGTGSGAVVGANGAGSASMFGTAASAIAGGAVGLYGGRAISGGYSAIGSSGNAAVNLGTVAGGIIGAIFGAPGVGAAIGGAIGGVVNRVFGRKAPEVESRAIEGSITGSNFSGSTVTNIVEKGGLFRSDKRYSDTQAITGDLDKALDEGAAQLSALAAKYGAALGLPAEALAGVTAQIKVAITDNAEDNAKAIAAALEQYADALLGTFADDVEPLRKSGETVAQTIERVGGALLSVNDSLELLGAQALAASVDGGKAALALADAFGGADTFAQAASGFYEKFYTEGERAERATQQLTASLAEFGLAVPDTRAAYRELVQAQLALGEEGYPAAAALLGLADTFDALRTAAGDSATALADIAQQRKDLDLQLLELQGNTAAIRERERAALDDTVVVMGKTNAQIYDMIKALEDQADATEKATEAAEKAAEEAARAAERQLQRERGVVSGADAIVGDFLKGDALVRNRATRINEILTEGGITGGTIEGIIGSTREDIAALWNSVGTAGREAILEAYGLWEQLDELVRGTGRAVANYRSGSLADAIESARLANLSPADRIARLRGTEARLFGELATASDPVAVAERLTGVITDRIAEETRLQQQLGDTTLDGLKAQLDAAKSLRDVVSGIPQFTASLRFSDLSPLSPRQQVEEARKLFESTLVRAQGGDQVAISNLQANAQAYIAEAAAAFGSDQRAADVFDRVTGALDQFAAVVGPGLDPRIAQIEAQITAAESTAENTGAMLEALLSIDAALGGRVSGSSSGGAAAGTNAAGGSAVVDGINAGLNAGVGAAGAAGTGAGGALAGAANAQMVALLARVDALATQVGAVAANTLPIAAGVAVDQEGYAQLVARLRAIEAQQAQIVSQLNYATS